MHEHSISKDKAESGDGGGGGGFEGGGGGGCEIPSLMVTTPDGSQHAPQFLPDDIYAAIVWSAKFAGGVQGDCGTWSGIPRFIGQDIGIYGSEFPKNLGTNFRDEHPSWSEMHADHLELYHQGTNNGYIHGEAIYDVNGAWNGTVEFKWFCGWQADGTPTPALSEPEPELVADTSDEAADELREIFGINRARTKARAKAGTGAVIVGAEI